MTGTSTTTSSAMEEGFARRDLALVAVTVVGLSRLLEPPLIWIAAATVVGRLRASAVHLRGVGFMVAVLAGAWLLPAFRLSTLALVAFLLVSTGCRSMINALNYAVGARASEGTSAPMVIGVMNLAWAVTALVTPLLAGLAEGSSEVRFAFAATGLVAGGVALVLLVPRPRARVAVAPS